VAAKFQNKKEVPKADGKGTTTVYEYGPRQVSNRNREKAKRVEKLRTGIQKLRGKYTKDLAAKDPKKRLTALAVALIDHTYERVGNEGSADDGHYGVTTWEKDHVSVSGNKATITYVGKSGVKHKKEVTDAKIVAALKKALEGKSKGDRVLCEGDDCQVLAPDVNAYLEEFDITAKDIRGLHANEEMRSSLQRIRKEGPKLPAGRKEKDAILKKEFKQALEEAAAAVGHEAATLKSQYLVPGMEDAYVHDGTVLDKLHKKSSLTVSLPKGADFVSRVGSVWKPGPGGTLLGFKVMRYDPQTGNAVSGADSRLSLPLRRGAVHRMRSPGIFLGASPTYVTDYYANHDFNVVLTYAFDPDTVTTGDLEDREPEITVPEAKLVDFNVYDEDMEPLRVATKTHGEVEDEEARRLVRKSPKLKPPRTDLERGRVEEKSDVDRDPDADQDKKDRSKNYKDSSSTRVALRYYLAKVTETESGFRAERSDVESPKYFETKDEADAWVDAEDPQKKDEKGADKAKSKKDDKSTGKPQAPQDLEQARSDLMDEYRARGLSQSQITEVTGEISKPEDASAAKDLLEEAAAKAEKDKSDKATALARKKTVQDATKALSKASKKDVEKALESFSDEEAAAFVAALDQASKSLAQNGPSGTNAEFAEDVADAIAVLGESSGRGKELRSDPEELAAAIAAITYYEAVVDNPENDLDPDTEDPVGPVPKSSTPITNAKDLKSVQGQALRRGMAAVRTYRDGDVATRQKHYARVTKEIEQLIERDADGNETPASQERGKKDARRIHLEGLQKGIGMAAALEDGDEAQGVGGMMARLVRAADKSGNLESLMAVNSVNSTEAGDADFQAVIRSTYADLTNQEWPQVLGKDHPGADLADVLSDPEKSRYLSEEDKSALRERLMDMVVAEAAFMDPHANRELDPDATVADKNGVAKNLRAKSVSSRPSTSSPLKQQLDWFRKFLKEMTSSANKGRPKKGSLLGEISSWDFEPWPKVGGGVSA